MLLKVLGSAAGGGFPQWNCHCRSCQGQRRGTLRAAARTQSSLAIAADGGRWVLVNASPDVRHQLETLLRPEAAPVRWSPVQSVVLTDSQIDHATGLLFLREAGEALTVYCTDPVFEDLTGPFPVLTMLGFYAGVERRALPVGGEPLRLTGLGTVGIIALPLGGKAPPYSPRRGKEAPATNVALALQEQASGKSAVYAPALAALTPELAPYLAAADLLLLDGTCWHDDDLARSGAGTKTARSMGHLPLSGADGLLTALACYPRARKVLVHINNTNPILDEDGPERRLLAEHGVELGYDGMEIEL